jgi:signal transduction histidine kinase
VLGLALETTAIVVNVLYAPDRLPERLTALAADTSLSLGGLWFATRRRRSRYTTPVVSAYVLALGSVLVYQVTLSPTDLDALTGPVSWVMIGSMLFFPWGVTAQASVSGFLLLAYFAVLGPHLGATGMRAANVTLSLAIGGALSVAGALVLDRSRAAAFAEHRRVRGLAVQRRRLIDVGRDLRSTLGIEALRDRLVAHAARHIPADGIALVLAPEASAVYRISAATGGAASLLDRRWEGSFAAAFRAAFAPAEVRESPGSPLDPLLLPALQSLGMKRVLVAAVGPHPLPAGFIGWWRRAGAPFSRGERLAAQGIADQAFTAFGTARLYEAAARASRLKSEFVSTMSHELRTPLNVIMGYNQLLTEMLPAKPEYAQALDAIRRASVELLELVEATLDLGRLEAGREQVHEEAVAMDALFDELAAEFAAVPRAAGVALLWDAGEGPSPLTDRRKLKTVLKNLVGNALKFTPAGSVRVECRRAGDACQLRVIDTGIGIRREDQAIIFEMFRQADSSDSRRYGGAGLGLYIVHQLVQLLDGHVTLESAPGQGSIFTVTLPRYRAPSRERPAA